MTPESILLSIRDTAGEGSYRFACPTCMNTIEKPADRKVVALLLSAGVELEDVGGVVTAESAEHNVIEPHPAGPSLTVDDLINFHFLLQDDREIFRALERADGG
jgi:hypothetical protein